MRLIKGTILDDNDVKIELLDDEIIKNNQRNLFFAENGLGKTTIFKSILNQKNYFKIENNKTIKIGYLPQFNSNCLFGLPVIEELGLTNSVDFRNLDEIIECFNLRELFSKNSQLLSEGEKRRVSIAASLISSTDVWIADEWSNNLDQKWIVKTNNYIDRIVAERGITTIEFNSKHCNGYTQKRLQLKKSFTENNTEINTNELNYVIRYLVRKFTPNYSDSYHNGIIRNGKFYKKIDGAEFSKGELISVSGKNGTGKTSFLRGVRCKNNFSILRKKPAVIFADPRHQINFGSIFNTLKTLEISNDIRAKIELVLRTKTKINLHELNYSSCKILAILLSITNKTQTICIDEPFSGLDHKNSQLVSSILNELRHLGYTIIITLFDKQDKCDLKFDRVISL